MKSIADVVVIGGGIVGLATAREVTRQFPHLSVVLLEKEARTGMHQTGHNSGVVHAGIYYQPGSQRARLCVQGMREMYEFAERNRIPFRMPGKLVVASSRDEEARLERLFERAKLNGVPGVELLGPRAMRELEPHVGGIRAIYSPHTGIVDYRAVARVLETQVRESVNGHVMCGFDVVHIDAGLNGSHVISRTGSRVSARAVIACAGLHADRVAAAAGGAAEPRIVPFRGSYYRLRPEAAEKVSMNIYPVPDPRLPFLGVHLTPTLDGGVLAGPNAVLALHREGYGSRLAVRPSDAWDALSFGGLWALARRYMWAGAKELTRDASRVLTARSLRHLAPWLRARDLVAAPEATGIRAQALTGEGELVDDFVMECDRSHNVLHVRNAPSPACTASLVIARDIVAQASRAGMLEGGGHITGSKQ